MWSDDGIALGFSGVGDGSGTGTGEGDVGVLGPALEELVPGAAELDQLLAAELGRSALFATHFRENAARALLLPRRRAGARTPLWAQRLRAQRLLAAAGRHPDFPIVLETYRECLHDVFDLTALRQLLADVRGGAIALRDVTTPSPSPFARSLALAYVAAFMYEGDAPPAERRAQALALDRNLLAELLGPDELRELLDADVIDEVEAELQGLADDRRAHHADALHDLLRRAGDLSDPEVAARCDPPADAPGWIAHLSATGRAARATVAGQSRWIAVEDAALYADVSAAAAALVARFARTHGPFEPPAVAARLGLPEAAVRSALRELAGKIAEGAYRPGGTRPEWCDLEVLRRIRRRTLDALRARVAPVGATTLAGFLPRWHGVGSRRGGLPRLREALDQLEGLPLPLGELERELLPARVADYTPHMLDELGALGEWIWLGRGAPSRGGQDGRVALYRRDRVHLLADPPPPLAAPTPLHALLLEQLETRGASFYLELVQRAAPSRGDDVLAALWDLVWAGLVSNDTFQPLRARGPRRAEPSRRRRAALALQPQAAGRWSATRPLLQREAGDTARAHERARLLLDRYGVVTREAALAEGLPGGFAAIAPVLRAMEEAGKLRRGYFVQGLEGAQYARATAIEMLRSEAPAGVVLLSAVDPACAYGLLLPWPDAERAEGEAGRARRVAGARVALVAGVPALALEAAGHHLRVLTAREDAALAALEALRDAGGARRRTLRVTTINGQPALKSPLAGLLERTGFRVEPGGLTLER